MTIPPGPRPDLLSLAARLAPEVAHTAVRAATVLGAHLPDEVCDPLGRLGDGSERSPAAGIAGPAAPGQWWSGSVVEADPAGPGGLPTTLAHRILGAVDTALGAPTGQVPAEPVREHLRGAARGAGSGHEGTAVAVVARRGHDAFAGPVALLRATHPDAGPLCTALLAQVAATPEAAAHLADTTDPQEPRPAAMVAARHGRCWSGLALAVADIVTGAAVPGSSDRAATTVALGLDAVAAVLPSTPMPSGWGAASEAERRATFLLPATSSAQLTAGDGRIALVPFGDGTVVAPPFPDGIAGPVAAVGDALVVRTGGIGVPAHVTLEVTAHPPEQDSDPDPFLPDVGTGWEEIAELSWESPGALRWVGQSWPRHDGLGVPWPTTLRVRVHTSGRGAGAAEYYLVRMWEAAPAPATVLREDPVPSSLPLFRGTALLRTDRSDDAAWVRAVERISAPSDPDGFLANVEPVDDPRFAGASVADLLALATPAWCRAHSCLFVVDEIALASDEVPVLVVGLHGEHRGATFRCAAAELWGVENNLSLANLDFASFAEAVDGDGVHRGFD